MTVEEKLTNYTREQLVEVAKEIKLKGYSKLKKAELIQAIVEKLNADGKTEEFMGNAADSAEEVIKTEPENTDEVCVYCRAFAKIYGIIPTEKAVDIYNSQNDKITVEEFKKRAAAENGWEITDEYFTASDLDTDAKRHELLSLQNGKEFYIPSKEEIEAYASDKYIGTSKEYNEFRMFIMNNFEIYKDKLDKICHIVYLYCELGYTADQIISELRYSYAVEAQTKQQLNTLQVLVRTLINNVRKRVNCGFTTMELYENSNGRQRMFIPSSMHTKAAVGRNEPCPCGSGKKYKQCCGK